MTSCPAGRTAEHLSSQPQLDLDTLTEADEFIRTCRAELGTTFTPEKRLEQIVEDIGRTGTYHQTTAELRYGCQLAWRNSLDCLGKGMWRRLEVCDYRHATTPDLIFEACVEHLRVATRSGRIRAVMTVLPPAAPDGTEIRIWNKQLVRYAGYRRPDGSVIGDPDTVSFTERVHELGWRGQGTPFDILPIVIGGPGDRLRWYPIPCDAILEVPLVHPELSWFSDLKLRWYAHPTISNQLLRIGGVRYPAAPFSGWYTGTEVALDNLGSASRYNVLPDIARRMGLDMTSTKTLWRDRATLELLRAVMHSYVAHRVTIVDHHSAAASFVRHSQRESAAGRPTRARWKSLVGAVGGSPHAFDSDEYDESVVLPNFFSQAVLGDGR